MREHTADKQLVDVSQIEFFVNILDVGGGGEGVIARHSGHSVVAIDRRKDELEETADIGLKIVMDACNMAFLDRTFENITSFYTLMYMDLKSVKAFLKEAYRVLKPNGLLWIWDTEIPCLNESDIFIVPLEVKINTTHILSTGYGVGWNRDQTSQGLQKLISDAGFTVEKSVVLEHRFEYCCRKC